jgi:hypothetical protein
MTVTPPEQNVNSSREHEPAQGGAGKLIALHQDSIILARGSFVQRPAKAAARRIAKLERALK